MELFGCDMASELFIIVFVNHSEKLYGPEFLVYNVHISGHLADGAASYGPLDSLSAFPFENLFGFYYLDLPTSR